tara:strand:- start:138 stop:284 length:147 start_codon:yes stop_codon:yes gene_type:complete
LQRENRIEKTCTIPRKKKTKDKRKKKREEEKERLNKNPLFNSMAYSSS